MTQMLGAAMASAFDRPNRISTPMNRRLRSMLAISAVSSGPVAATVKANSVTSRPAWDGDVQITGQAGKQADDQELGGQDGETGGRKQQDGQ